ncbi:MAG: tetratricopeptide repeat protein, partial [Limisphaerales bacterium]
FLLAAEQGDAQSQFSLGVRWARGEAGEPQDFAEAAKWFRLAADQGLDDAQLSLGRRYANGEGVAQDYVEAYKWVLLAQEQGKVTGAGKLLSELTPKMTADQINTAKQRARAFVPKAGIPLR